MKVLGRVFEAEPADALAGNFPYNEIGFRMAGKRSCVGVKYMSHAARRVRVDLLQPGTEVAGMDKLAYDTEDGQHAPGLAIATGSVDAGPATENLMPASGKTPNAIFVEHEVINAAFNRVGSPASSSTRVIWTPANSSTTRAGKGSGAGRNKIALCDIAYVPPPPLVAVI